MIFGPKCRLIVTATGSFSVVSFCEFWRASPHVTNYWYNNHFPWNYQMRYKRVRLYFISARILLGKRKVGLVRNASVHGCFSGTSDFQSMYWHLKDCWCFHSPIALLVYAIVSVNWHSCCVLTFCFHKFYFHFSLDRRQYSHNSMGWLSVCLIYRI